MNGQLNEIDSGYYDKKDQIEQNVFPRMIKSYCDYSKRDDNGIAYPRDNCLKSRNKMICDSHDHN